MPSVACMDQLEIGQAWVYPATDDTPPLMAAIGGLDDIEYEDGSKGLIVSVRVEPHPKAREQGWTTIGHMPVMADAFLKTGVALDTNPVELGEDFAEGYDKWRDAFDAGEGGAFTHGVSEAYLAIVQVAAQQAAHAD